MRMPCRSCVKCGATLQNSEILAAGPFDCPHCHTKLQAPNSYGGWIGLCTLLFSAGIFYMIGLHGLGLAVAIILSWLPIQYVALNSIRLLIPPRIEIYLPRENKLNLRD